LFDFVVSGTLTYAAYMLFIVVYRYTFKPEIDPDATGIILYFVITYLIMEVLYSVRRSKDAFRDAETAKSEAILYQYDSLKAHVNPHFLFNSLNILLAMIDTDTRKASAFTISLSHIYRYILATQGKSMVTVADEMSFLESYIDILKIKYEDNLIVEIQDHEPYATKLMVPCTLQLLVENITKHNAISDKYPMHVMISMDEHRMTISNSIRLKNNHAPEGFGLKYLASQYRANGKTFTVTNDGRTFVAAIPFCD
jgi:LytS/YehU family sensor histidine kinase